MVSVIILTWNRVKLLQETIASILNQTYPRFELLVIDNESTDDTEEYIKSLTDKRIRYFKNPNGGILSVNRNFGIRHSRGDYIAFCDDDDLWEPKKLEVQLEFLNTHPQYKMVSTNAVYFSDGFVIGKLIKRREGEITIDDFLSGKNYVVISSALISKEVFSEVGFFSEDPEIINVADYQLWMRVVQKHRVYFLDECLVRYRIHGSMTSHKDTRQTIMKEKVMFLKLFKENVINKKQYEIVQKNLARKYFKAGIKELIKKIGFAKNLVYWIRKTRFALFSKPNQFKGR